MKKEFIIGIGLIVLIIGIVGMAVIFYPSGMNQKKLPYEQLDNSSQSISDEILGGQRNTNIQYNSPIRKFPDQVAVYKTNHSKITKEDAIAFARKFNVTDINEPKEGASAGGDTIISLTSKDRRYRITLSSNGGRQFEDTIRANNANGIDIPDNLPTDRDAEKIAIDFLKQNDLLPEGAVFWGSKHQQIFQSTGMGKNQIVVWEDILIGYSRKINGMDVDGTQFMVEIGGQGDVISYFTNWKDYNPIGEYPVKSEEIAFIELKNKGAMVIDKEHANIDSVSINRSYLKYRTTALAYHEDYLEPVWVFEGNGIVNNEPVGFVHEYIPALTDDAVKSLTSL